MVLRCPHDDRSSRQLITYSPERRSGRSHTPASKKTRERANNAERNLPNAGNAATDVLGCRVRDGVTMTASWTGPAAESTSRTIDTDAQVRRTGTGELAAMIQRLRAKRMVKRREQREFKAWLQITRTHFGTGKGEQC